MNCKGLKLAVLGDSITEGVGVSDPGNLYYNRVKDALGFRSVCVNGISGSRFAAQITPTYFELRADRHFVSRVEEIDEDSDVIVVFGGTNDYGHGDAPIGTIQDFHVYSFYGACNLLCSKLIDRFPDKTIVFMTPLHRTGEEDPCGTPGRKSGPVGTLSDYISIIREVAERYSIPILDLYRTSGINPCNRKQKELYMPDGLHPNDLGHERISARLTAFLKNAL